jgi:acyl-coenzyme A thioesterase PaaI-like protein
MVHTRLQKVISTLEQKQSYLRPVPLNRQLLCRATFLRQGKDVAFYESEICNEATGEVLAKASQTAMLVPVVRGKAKSKL